MLGQTTEIVGYGRWAGARFANTSPLVDAYNKSGGAVTQTAIMNGGKIVGQKIKFAGLNLINNYQIQVSVHDDGVGYQDNYCRVGTVTSPEEVEVYCFSQLTTHTPVFYNYFSIWVVQNFVN